MKLIPLSTTGKHAGKYFAQVDDDMYPFLIHWKWSVVFAQDVDGLFYATRGGSINGKAISVRMHRFILGITDPKIEVDHKDHNGLNNQRQNLRYGSKSQNQSNYTSTKGSTSKYLGISWCATYSRWVTQIRIDGKGKFIGAFKDEIEAAKAYDRVAKEKRGEWANLNFK